MEVDEGTNLPPTLPVAIGGLGSVYTINSCSSSSIGTVHGVGFEVVGTRGKSQVQSYGLRNLKDYHSNGCWLGTMSTPFDGPVTGIPRYPVIDTDPHAFRVVRYFRSRDYATWGVVTAGFPASMYLWGRIDPLRGMPKGAMRRIYGISATVGLIGGFLMAYQDSSKRFWGWSENTREQDLARIEIKKKIAEGKPIYGTSDEPEHMQRVAVSNSRHSQLFFSIIPWFNFVNHPYHGDFANKVASEMASEDK